MQKTIKLIVASMLCSGVVFFCLGCEKQSEPPKQQAVKQRIPAENKKAAASAEKAVAPPASTSPSDITKENQQSKAQSPSTPGVKTKTPEVKQQGTEEGTPPLPPADEDQAVVAKAASDGVSVESAAGDAEEAMPGATTNDGAVAALSGPTAEDAWPEATLMEDQESEEEPGIDFDLGLEEEEAAAEEASLAAYNPFAPLFKKKKAAMQASGSPDDPRSNRAFLTPLEQIGLGQVTLTGIVQAQSGNRAMVKDASGKGYVLRKGTYIGLHSGRVEKITGDRVIVVEIIDGRESVAELKLQKSAGE